MQFESQMKRSFWITSVLGVIPDLVLSAVITYFIVGSVGTCFLVFLAIQAVYFVFWVKKTIWEWTVFGVAGRKRLTSALLDYLKANKYPEPGMYQKSPDDYFGDIIENEELTAELRMKAVSQLTTLNAAAQLGLLQHSVRVSMAYEDAISQYKNTFPTRQAA